MNERIKELMIEHNIHVDFKNSEYVFEKFAELIVKECMKVADDRYQTMFPSEVIARHFGVE